MFCFGFVYTSDSSKSEIYLNILCYRHEVETPQEKAALCHFLGNISRIIFPRGIWILPLLPLPWLWIQIRVYLLDERLVELSHSLPPVLQVAKGKCHLEAAAGAMGDEGSWVWGAAFLPDQGSSQMNRAVKGAGGERKRSPRQFTWRNKITWGMIDKLVALCTLF